MRVVRSNAMVPGFTYGLAFYDSKDTIHRAVLLSRPHTSVNDMRPSDRFVFQMEESKEKVEFFKNACFPYYLETRRKGRSGRMRNCRITFYEVEQPANVAETETETSAKALMVIEQPKVIKPTGQPVGTPEVITLGHAETVAEVVAEEPEEVADEKPVRADGENFGQYQKRLKAWKKRNLEMA